MTTISSWWAAPTVDGVAVFEDFDARKHDLAYMLRCCDAVEADYYSRPFEGRLLPAPAYFRRVAILARKARDDAGEQKACERWLEMIRDYAAQQKVVTRRAAYINPTDNEFVHRLAKIKARPSPR